MADGEIVLTKSVRGGVEKLDFDRKGASWRVVMERPGAPERTRRGEVLRTYAGVEDAWKDVTEYSRQGYRIALYQE
jgi:hypothetical protein